MTKDEIRGMFRLAALERHTPECDRSKEMIRAALGNAVEQYKAEVLVPFKRDEDETGEEEPGWMTAMQYVAKLFSVLDSNEEEPDHDKMMAFRHKAWDDLSKALSRQESKPQSEDHVFNPVK